MKDSRYAIGFPTSGRLNIKIIITLLCLTGLGSYPEFTFTWQLSQKRITTILKISFKIP